MGSKQKQQSYSVQNPWSKRKGVVIFDIETEYGEGRLNRQKKFLLKFLCGVIYDYHNGQFYRFLDPSKFVQKLSEAKFLVSYNGEGFDFFVLKKYGFGVFDEGPRVKPSEATSFDIFTHIIQRPQAQKKDCKYPSLNDLCKVNLSVSKPAYNHGNKKELLDHCVKDVEYTKKLYELSMWKIPVISRKTFVSNLRYKYGYDDDIGGMLWDGEKWLNTDDFGSPISDPEHLPLEKIEKELRRCPSCKSKFEAEGFGHVGYGEGNGYQSNGRSLCALCEKGCYRWDRDDTPGFRDSHSWECCHCKGTNQPKFY